MRHDDRPRPCATKNEWGPYILSEFNFVDFPKGSSILDTCGEGAQLALLKEGEYLATGVDVVVDSLLHCCSPWWGESSVSCA